MSNPPTSSSLDQRLKSALILAPAVLFVIFWGRGLFSLMAAVAAGICIWEWLKMVEAKGPKYLPHIGAGAMVIATAAAALLIDPVLSLWFYMGMAFLVFAFDWAQKGGNPIQAAFGVVYIGFSVATMIWLRLGTAEGLYNFMMLLFLIWASDSFAYFTGRAIGGPKLAPVISPKKTWAGFWGSSIGAALVLAVMGCPALLSLINVKPLAPFWVLAIAGFILAMFGQVGDLFISMFKRHYGIKDTGTLIPGHGGLLDRIDALLLVAPLFGMFVVLAGGK